MNPPRRPPHRRRVLRLARRLGPLLAILAWATPAPAATPVRVGVYENPPKIFTNAEGQADGILIDLLRRIAAAEDWQLTYVDCDWAECLSLLERGDIDLMPDVADSKARRSRFDLHQTPALNSWSQIYSASPRAAIRSLLDLRDLRISVLRDSIQESALATTLGGFGVNFEFRPADSLEAVFQQVRDGEADAAITNHYYGSVNQERFGLTATPIVLQPAQLFYATGRGVNAELLNAIDQQLNAWQGDAGSPYYQVLKRWIGAAPRTALSTGMRNVLLALIALGAGLAAGIIVLRRRVTRTTRELAEANRRLSATLDAVPDLLFEVDAQGRYLEVHSRRSDLLMLPTERFLGRRLDEVMPEAATRIAMDALAEAKAQGWSSGRAIELPLPTGTRWFELSVATKATENPSEPHFVVLSRDVTDRHRVELELRRMNGLYATLGECNEIIVRSADKQQLLQAICRVLVELGGMKMVWIGEADQDGQQVLPVASFGEGRDYLQGLSISICADEPSGRGPTGIAMRTDQAYWCQDFATDPVTGPWRDRARRYGWLSSAALPLHKAGMVAGVINIYAGETEAFEDPVRKLLLKLAMNVDYALEKLRENRQLVELSRAVAASEARYRELTESINDVIWTLDPASLRFTYVSPSVTRLRGYTPEEIMAAPMDAALTPTDAARVREMIDNHVRDFEAGRITNDDFQIEEVEQPCKDGSTVWTEVVTNYVRDPVSGRIEIRGVTRDISERKRDEARIQHLAHFDQLTGLPNRSLLKDRSNYALSLATRHRERVAVMFLDLDNFKNVNDTLGHEIGDLLLKEIGVRLKSVLRSGDTISRLGGDEFVVLLPDTDEDGATRVAGNLMAAIARPLQLDRFELNITPSIGIAMFPDDGADMDTLSRNADTAMYQVKKDGRNGFRFFTGEMQSRTAHTLQLANALHAALELDQFELRYQPQISLIDQRIVGAEALLRWRHPELGWVSPAEFVPIAESNGLITRIGEWVLRKAMAQARAWIDAGLQPLTIAINISAVQFRSPDLAEQIAAIVHAAGVPMDRLELELTEAVAMGDPREAIKLMDRLAGEGVRLSIDDFGTGYSSLSYLKRFKVGRLKIDQSFVRDIALDRDDRAIVIAIINLARSLGIAALAEGVETREQLEFLRAEGCAEVQGFYFSRPLTAGDFEDYLQTWNNENPATT